MNTEIKQKKHIDVIVKYFYPVAAGIETNVMETYTILNEENWDVSIHTSKDVYLEKNILAENENIRGLNIMRYPFKLFGYFPDINWSETDMVCLHNFDIFPHFRILSYCLWLKITNRKKFALILTPHGGFNPEWRIFNPLQKFIKKLYHYTLGVLLINLVVDGVRAVSEWEKAEIISKGVRSELVVVIDNGLEDQAYQDVENMASSEIKEKVEGYGKYIIQVGRVYMIKNYETTINALVKLPEDLNYVIVGPVNDAKYKQKLEELIISLELEKRVFFTGVVRGIDKYYLMKNAQMMVHMALWESYCNVIHEGMSQGLVCIVANNTALPYLIKNNINGYCVNTTDSDEVAKKIAFVMENKNTPMIQEMIQANIEFGLKNSWREVAGKMDEFYNNSLNKISSNKI